MPKYWYNVRADMKNKPAPLLNPGTHKPVTYEELSHVFCDELVKQELDDIEARKFTRPSSDEYVDFEELPRD